MLRSDNEILEQFNLLLLFHHSVVKEEKMMKNHPFISLIFISIFPQNFSCLRIYFCDLRCFIAKIKIILSGVLIILSCLLILQVNKHVLNLNLSRSEIYHVYRHTLT